MKKIFSVIVIISMLFCGVAIASPAYRQSPGIGDILGQGKLPSDPHRVFRMVRYVPLASGTAGSAKLSADSICVWDTVSDDGVTVTTTTTSYDSAVAGIIVLDILTPDEGTLGNTAVNDMGKRNWGWLQTYGLSEVTVQADGVASVKSALGTGSECGKASLFVGSTTSSTVQGNAGFYYDAVTTTKTDAEVFVCLD